MIVHLIEQLPALITLERENNAQKGRFSKTDRVSIDIKFAYLKYKTAKEVTMHTKYFQ